MKTLIAFFSHAGENYFGGEIRNIEVGNAKVIANKIKKMIDADLFEIEPVKTYPFNYRECCDEAMKEKNNMESVELKNYLPSIDGYDKIILVYPCWWGSLPQVVSTFLEHNSFSGKDIYPLCTHEGSGMGSSQRDISRICLGAVVHEGLPVQGSSAYSCDKILASWLDKNDIS